MASRKSLLLVLILLIAIHSAHRSIADAKLESTAGQDADVCQLPRLRGHCRALIPRWYFNAEKGGCVRFRYGGCGGNGNNFGTSEECQQRCTKSSNN